MTPTPDEPLMTIGSFSRASLLSAKSLRSYHEQGILVPASVDPRTGYRGYLPTQLNDAIVLRRLRELDLPLADVRTVLHARDPAITRDVLARHEAEIRSRLNETQRILDDLQHGIASPIDHTPVEVRRLDNEHALAISGEVPSKAFAEFLGAAYPLLGEALARGGLVPTGPGSALYASEVHDHDAEPVTAYIPVAEARPVPPAAGGVRLIELPTETVAVVHHHGTYDDVGDTYAALGAWVARNASSTGGHIREIYEVSVPDTDDPTNYRTAICWPIDEQEHS